MKRCFVALMVFLGSAAATFGAQEQFRWQGELAPGLTLEIKGVNGSIEVQPNGSDTVEIEALKKGRQDDPSEVKIEIVPHAGGLTVCAVYPGSFGRQNHCAPGSEGSLSSNRNDVTVDFTVYLPAGRNLVAKTVNGGVEATGIGGDVQASTVNGDIAVSCEGEAAAKTVNGSIRASLGSSNWEKDLEFETVNGSITVEAPRSLNAEVDAKTVNGSIENDFGLEVKGKWGPKKMKGTVGNGSMGLGLSTVNGSIELVRGKN